MTVTLRRLLTASKMPVKTLLCASTRHNWIGRDPDLVMHGGGNTSVKGHFTNILGERVPAIFVKGSGWNLDTIEPAGLPVLICIT